MLTKALELTHAAVRAVHLDQTKDGRNSTRRRRWRRWSDSLPQMKLQSDEMSLSASKGEESKKRGELCAVSCTSSSRCKVVLTNIELPRVPILVPKSLRAVAGLFLR